MTTPQISPKIAPEDLDVDVCPRTSRIDSADDAAKAPHCDRSEYDLTKTEDLRSYLKEHRGLDNFDLQALTGGTANYVYRLTRSDTGRTQILKHAAAHLASAQDLNLSSVRMNFEAEILTRKKEDESECHCTDLEGFDISAIEKTHVHTVPLEYYERDIKLLCIQDSGKKNLKDAYADLSPNEVQDIGTEIGKWLAKLHGTTPLSHVTGLDGCNNLVGVDIASFTYRHLADTLKMYGDAAQAEKISNDVNRYSGDLIASDRESVCHGDFWPGNIMLQSKTPSKGPHLLTVIDWELARVGNSATDIGQFAAEAFMLDRFHGGKGLHAAFIRAYFKASAVKLGSKETLYPWMTRIAMHFAVHLAVWPSRSVHWANGEDTAALALHALRVLIDAMSSTPNAMHWKVFDGLDGLTDISREMMVKRGRPWGNDKQIPIEKWADK